MRFYKIILQICSSFHSDKFFLQITMARIKMGQIAFYILKSGFSKSKVFIWRLPPLVLLEVHIPLIPPFQWGTAWSFISKGIRIITSQRFQESALLLSKFKSVKVWPAEKGLFINLIHDWPCLIWWIKKEMLTRIYVGSLSTFKS